MDMFDKTVSIMEQSKANKQREELVNLYHTIERHRNTLLEHAAYLENKLEDLKKEVNSTAIEPRANYVWTRWWQDDYMLKKGCFFYEAVADAKR